MHFSKIFISKLFRSGILFVVFLVLMDILTYFFYPDTVLGKIFLATREQTPLTWVSAVILLLIGFSCATVYLKTKNRIWYFLSLVFLFFSMDDATYFHERLSGSLVEIVPFMKGLPTYSWVVLYFPLLVFGLGGLVYMLWHDASKKDKRMLKFAVLLLGLSIFLDLVDGFVGKSTSIVFCLDPTCDDITTHIIRLTEEVLEVVGMGMLAYLNIREHALIDGVKSIK